MLVVGTLVFLSVFLGILGIATAANAFRSGSTTRLDRIRKTEAPRVARASPFSSLLIGDDDGVQRLLGRLGGGRAGTEVGALRQRLIRAGYRRPNAPAIYYGLRLLLAASVPAAAMMVPWLWSQEFFIVVAVLVASAAIAYVAPSAAIDRRVAARIGALDRALPDALDLMVVCVEAGFGINQALARVADEFGPKSPVLSGELGLVNSETRAGKSLTDSLRGLSERTGSSDISALVALLVQTERFGTSVANALRVHADAMRIRRMHRAEERAQLAPLKLILPSTMIFAALMIVFVVPAVLRVQEALP